MPALALLNPPSLVPFNLQREDYPPPFLPLEYEAPKSFFFNTVIPFLFFPLVFHSVTLLCSSCWLFSVLHFRKNKAFSPRVFLSFSDPSLPSPVEHPHPQETTELRRFNPRAVLWTTRQEPTKYSFFFFLEALLLSSRL